LLLCTKVHVENHFHHELASRQVFLSNPAIIKAARLLYYDEKKRKPKRGAQDPERPGNLFRFVRVLQQLDLNYDLYGMDAHAILDLLPDEFDEWRKKRRFSLRRKTALI